jgi:tripeptide aminopeptidase
MATKLHKSKSIPKSTNLVSDAEALGLVMQMMAIPGRSRDEAAIMEFICGQLQAGGVQASSWQFDDAHRRTPHSGPVGNLVLKLPGTVRGPRRMLSAHVDTVPVCVGSRPVRKGRFVRAADKETGVGADDRSGAAVLLTTVLDIVRGGLSHPPLTFLWTVQEEVGLFGARYVRKPLLGGPKLAFNFDGSSATRLTIAATGGYRMTIEVRGIAAHAGNRPEEGVSAIAIASLAIADLVKNGWHGLVAKPQGQGTSNVGMIAGGEATNVVTDRVLLHAEARSHEPKFRGRIVKEIERAFERAARAVRSTAGKHGTVRFEGQLDYEAFRLPRDEPCVLAASAAVRSEGREAELAITNGGLDANWLTAHGIPTVSLGCGQKNIHSTEEELDIAEFHLARRVALRLATEPISQ